MANSNKNTKTALTVKIHGTITHIPTKLRQLLMNGFQLLRGHANGQTDAQADSTETNT